MSIRSAAIDDALAVDEIGLWFGVLGPLRAKTSYRPIFARSGERVYPVGVAAGVVLQREGVALGAIALSALPADIRILADAVGRRLALRNLQHLDFADAEPNVMIGLAGSDAVAEADSLLTVAAEADVSPDRICFDLSESDAPAVTAAGLERQGCGVSLDLEAASHTPAPRLIRIPAAWTRRIVSEPELSRLLRLLVSTLRQRGAVVQIEGIDDALALRAAITAGADRLQGDLLAAPLLAGMAFDDRPRSFADLIGVGANVVPLSA